MADSRRWLALLAGLAGLAALARRARRRRHPPPPELSDPPLDASPLPPLWPGTMAAEARGLMLEQLSRSRAFHGEGAHARLREAFVVVVGLGSGVGTHVAHMLVRGGVPRVRLVSAARVSRASLATDAVAETADLGRPCAEVLREHLLQTVPAAQIEVVLDAAVEPAEPAPAARGGAAAMRRCVLGAPTLVIDCQRVPGRRAALMRACARAGVAALSVGQCELRTDLTRLLYSTLADGCATDALVHATHAALRTGDDDDDDDGDDDDDDTRAAYAAAASATPVLMCAEPLAPLVGAALAEGAASSAPPALAAMHAAAVAGIGQAVCLAALAQLARQPLPPQPPPRILGKLRTRLHAGLVEREAAAFGVAPKETAAAVSPEGAELVAVAGWQMRCAVSGQPYDSSVHNLALARYDRRRPLSVSNLVLLRVDLAERHERHGDGRHGVPVIGRAERAYVERVCALLGGGGW